MKAYRLLHQETEHVTSEMGREGYITVWSEKKPWIELLIYLFPFL